MKSNVVSGKAVVNLKLTKYKAISKQDKQRFVNEQY